MEEKSTIKITPQTTYRFICMRRSGHHAIMRWLDLQLRNPKVYRNDVTCRKDGIDDEFEYHEEGVDFNKKKTKVEAGEIKCLNFIFNHEDEIISECLNKKMNTDGKVINIVVLRDVYNMFASRLKCGFVDNSEKSFKKSVLKWKEYANMRNDPRVFFINYNKWVLDKVYREKIAISLNVPKFNDRKHNFVPSAGGGSSFDGRKYNKRTEEMDVMNRWKEFKDHIWFKELYDEEIVELNNKIFHD